MSSDNHYLVASFYRNGMIELWDIQNEKLIKILNVGSNRIFSVAFSPNGKYIISVDGNNQIKIWDRERGVVLVTMISFKDGEWISITPDGYFDASKNGAKYLNILIDSLTVTSIDAYYEKFYRPKIVALALQGESMTNLLKIEDQQAPPKVLILDEDQTVKSEILKVRVKITPKEGGVGKIRLLVDGSAISLDTRDFTTQQYQTPFIKEYTVKLHKGVNQIEIVAFNKNNSIESRSNLLKITSVGHESYKPNIHALIVGIKEFDNSDFNLKNTLDDAQIFREVLEQQRGVLFDEVYIDELLGAEKTTKASILKHLKAFETMNPNDLFVFYVGTHGVVKEGVYYLIPSNIKSNTAQSIRENALSEEEIQVAISNIPTSQKFILFDTCNSGKVVNGLTMALLNKEMQREAIEEIKANKGVSDESVLNILSRSTGSIIMSASTSQEAANENYKGHGLFTYVLVEALKGEADRANDNNGIVDTSELKRYVAKEVQKISKEEKNISFQRPIINNSGEILEVAKVQ